MSSVGLPQTRAVTTELAATGVLTLTLNRPQVRNAMNLEMVGEIEAVFAAVRDRRDVRVVVLRGAGDHFCAGGDIRDMAAARSAPAPDPGEGGAASSDAVAAVNRRFGTMVAQVDRAPQAVVVVLHGAVLGGAMGLACVADIALATADARFGLPETGLGIPPAQIAPFLVRRLGLSTARRLAVTGGRFNGEAAHAMGLVHSVVADAAALHEALDAALTQILRCAPGAVAATKQIMSEVGAVELDILLDEAAAQFAAAVRGPEGVEGTTAFLQKRPPAWATPTKDNG